MITDQTHLSLADDVAFRSLGQGQQTVVVSLASGYLYTCNETTHAFLQALGGGRTFGQIVDALAQEYDVLRQELSSDLAAMAQQLIHEQLVKAG